LSEELGPTRRGKAGQLGRQLRLGSRRNTFTYHI
jgi:hypothetical protein